MLVTAPRAPVQALLLLSGGHSQAVDVGASCLLFSRQPSFLNVTHVEVGL